MAEEREWYPANWVDESCPAAKDAPEGFIVADGEGWRLGYAADDKDVLDDDRESCSAPLTLGDVVDFMCCDRLDDVEITLRRDGTHKLRHRIPPDHNWVTFYGDMDTLRDSFEEMLRELQDQNSDLYGYLFSDGKDEELVTLMFARWSDRLPHQFVIDDGKPMFRQVPAAKTN